MTLPSELVSSFVKANKDTDKTQKESTVYGVVKNDANGKPVYVQIDGSDRYTPISRTANITEGDRVVVMIKDHTATIIGNITSPSATTNEVGENGAKITALEILIADKISTEELTAEIARIDALYSENVKITEELEAHSASIEALEAEDVIIENSLTAATARIDNLEANALTTDILDARYATIENLDAVNTKVYNLDATFGDFQELTTTNFDSINADISKLEAEDAEIEQLMAEKASIASLEAAEARIGVLETSSLTADSAVITNLQTEVADIDTLIFGSASGDTIQTSFANAVIAQLGDAQIKSAMIDSLSADKITSGDIITNNVRVLSEDGKLLISDETIQISDDTRVRVQIGKDAAGDYSINIWDADGNLMFSEGGITDSAIKEAIIRDDMVSETANISATKLNIESLFSVINNDGSNTINASVIAMDAEGQTLDVSFTQLTTDIEEAQATADQNTADIGELSTTVSSQGTDISVIQGQITSKVWQQDIDTATDEMTTQYSTLEQEIDSISATVASHTSQIAEKADSSTVTTVSDRVTTLESDLSGFKTTVSSTYATKTELDDITIGGRNLLLNSNFEYSNNVYATASYVPSSPLVPGTQYTISINVTPADGVTHIRAFVSSGWTALCIMYVSGSENQTVSRTFTMPSYYTDRTPDDDETYGHIQLYRYPNDGTVTENTTIHWAKIEKGNRATDWTPAPEDAATEISTLTSSHSELKQTVDSLSATVASHTTQISNKADNTTVTNVTSRVTTLETNLDGFKSTVSSTYTTKTEMADAIDNIEIGGRNLILNTATPTEIDASDYAYNYKRIYSELVQGETYTFSAEITLSGTEYLRVSIRPYNFDTAIDGGIYSLVADGSRVSQTFTVTTNTPYLLIYAGVAGYTNNISAVYSNIKLERGNKATDWTAAPEDLESRVTTAESRIDQNDSSITAAVTRVTANETSIASLQATADSLTSRVSSAQADIDNLSIGGRNLLKNSRHINLYSNNSNLYPITGEILTEDDREFTRYTRTETDMNPTTFSAYSIIPISSFTEHLAGIEITSSYLIRCSHETTTSTMHTLVIDGTNYYLIDSAANLPISNEWTRISNTVTISQDYDDSNVVLLRFNPYNIPIPDSEIDNFYIDVCEWKVEKGNRTTDWTPAPEDMGTAKDTETAQTTADTALETATSAETLVQQLSDTISMLVTDGNGTSLMEQTDSGWTFSTAEIQTNVSDVSEGLNTLTNELGNTNSTVDVLQQAVDDLGEIADYVKIGTYEDEPCIELGESDSDFKLLITNTRILFMEGSSIVAHITNQSLHIKKAVVEEELQQGGFVWQVRSNGNMGLVWKGASG